MSTPSRSAGPGPDPELIAPLVQACPAVAGLHGGAFGEVATYLPGRRVRGVRVTEAGIEIYVVGRYPATVTEIAAQVRAAILPVTGAMPVDLTVADIAGPGEPDPDNAILHDPIPATATSPATSRTAVAPPGPRAGAPTFPPPVQPEPGHTGGPAPADRLDPKESAR